MDRWKIWVALVLLLQQPTPIDVLLALRVALKTDGTVEHACIDRMNTYDLFIRIDIVSRKLVFFELVVLLET